MDRPIQKRAGIWGFFAAYLASGLLIFLVCESLAWTVGATIPPSMMATAQRENPRLVVLPPDLQYFAALKLARIRQEQPEIIMIGSSRCNEMRSGMLKPYRFYNACLSGWTFDQTQRMLDLILLDNRPRVVMFTMDYNMFSSGQDRAYGSRNAVFDEDHRFHAQGISAFLHAIWDFPAQTLRIVSEGGNGSRWEPVDGMLLMGMAANRAEAGFRYDGSFLYERGTIRAAETVTLDPTYDLQPGGPGVEERYFAALARMVETARRQNVTLVGVQLPMLRTTIEHLQKDKPQTAGVWHQFETAEVRSRIKQSGVAFFDLAKAPIYADRRNFIDPTHPNEAGILGALLHAWQDPEFRALFPALDVAALDAEAERARNRGEYMDIYRDRF